MAKEIELEDPYENMGAQLVREVASKTSDIAGDGTTTATVLAESIYKEGLRNVTAGANPTSLQRGHQQGRRGHRGRTGPHLQEGQRPLGNRAGCHRLGQLGQEHRRDHRRRDGQGRQGRHHHGRRSEVHRNQPRRGRRHAVRQGLPLALLRDQCREHGNDSRQPVHPHPREEDQLPQGPAPAPGKGGEERPSVAPHRGRRGRRSPRHARGEQAAWHVAGCGRQGPRLR